MLYSRLSVHHPEDFPRIVIIRFEKGRLAALDATNGSTLWSESIGYVKVTRRSGFNRISCPLITKDTICVGSTDRGLYALDISHGEQLWRYEAHVPVDGTPHYDDGTVFTSAWNGGHAVDIKTGKQLWHWKSEELRWFGYPSQGCVYGAIAGRGVIALDAKSGEMFWEVKCNISYGEPAFDGQAFYFYTLHGEVVRLDIQKRNLDIAIRMPQQSGARKSVGHRNLIAQPIIDCDQIFALAPDGKLFACDLRSGSILWSRTCGAPAVSDGIVYASAELEEGLLLLDCKTGRQIDFIGTHETPVSMPIIWNRVVFIAGWNTLNAINLEKRKIAWYRRYPEDSEIEDFNVG
jgi:outer membrane protein assembly factor BamB